MNCQDVANILDDHAETSLGSEVQTAVDRHLAGCTACAGAWNAALDLALCREIQSASPRPGFFDEAVAFASDSPRRIAGGRSFWAGVGVGGALAAGIALLAVLTFPAAPVDRGYSIPALTMPLNQVRNVAFAIDSVESLRDVEVRVQLAGGIELEPFTGRNSVSWRADLDPGVNRLTLPVVALDRAGGELVVEVEHQRKHKVFIVHIEVADPDFVTIREPDGDLSV